MMRRLVTFLFLLVAGPALAQFQPCPYVTAGWSKQYSGFAISSVSYDESQLLLYVIFGNTTASAFSNVPLGVMQGFSNTRDPVAYYSSAVLHNFHALLLAQTNNCPLLFETGAYIWSD
jgi:KTSC domain